MKKKLIVALDFDSAELALNFLENVPNPLISTFSSIATASTI